MNYKYHIMLPILTFLVAGVAYAGNPDRQGEAGAYELLINPWARSAGLHTLTTASVSGVEAMQINVSGLSRINKTQVNIGHTRYLVGSEMNLNALGLAQKVGKNGAFGVQLMTVDFGKIPLTTVETPEGSGATFSPSFTNIGLSYAYNFANKVSVGVTMKAVNESIANASARGIALDAGVQYVTGKNDNFKFGISLRNIGGKMSFSGAGLTIPRPSPSGTFDYNLSYYSRSAGFEMPSQLNIGATYDFVLSKSTKLTLVSNFSSNAFSRDNVGAGLELSVGKNFALRGGYKTEFGTANSAIESSLDNGLSGGFSVSLPVKKGSDTRIGLDYAYRSTSVFAGTHNLGIRIDM
jgi:hypothetical protein